MKRIYLLAISVLLVLSSCTDTDDNPSLDFPSVIITEVEYLGDLVELFNDGNITVDLSDYWFCIAPGTYKRIGDLPVQGNVLLEPGDFLVVDYGLDKGLGGLGLYSNNTDFSAAENMVDFVQWGDAASPREDVAVAAGLWTAGDFVPVTQDFDSSIAYDGEGNASTDWVETQMTSFGSPNN